MLQKMTISLSLTLTLCFLLPPSSASAASESSWTLRFGGVWVDTDGGSRQILADGDRVETDADTDFGFAITAERRFNERVGLEFGALMIASPTLGVRVSSDSESFEVSDDLGLQLFGAGLNFHLTPDKSVDFYLGPFVAYALFSDLSFVVADEVFPVRFQVDNELAYGAVLGLDVPINDRWVFNATARYFSLEIDPTGPDGGADPVNLDSISLGLGVGYRF